MGSRGPLPKPDLQGRRVRKGVGSSGVIQLTTIEGGLKAHQPDVPVDYRDETKKAWRDYWSSDLVQAVIDIDVLAVQQYFRLYDRWLHMMEIAEEKPFTTGSTGQITSHPAVGQAHQLLDDMTKLGHTLGITPVSRQRLGIVAAKAALTADEVNKMGSRGSKRPTRRGPRTIEAEWEAVD